MGRGRREGGEEQRDEGSQRGRGGERERCRPDCRAPHTQVALQIRQDEVRNDLKRAELQQRLWRSPHLARHPQGNLHLWRRMASLYLNHSSEQL